MKIKRWKRNTWIAALLPMVMVAAVWTRLPEQVPTNWNVNGSIDYSARWMLWVIAGFTLLIALLLTTLPVVDPKKANYQKFENAYAVIALATMLLLDAVMLIILTESLHPGMVNVAMVVELLVAVLMLVFGNVMPRFRPTWFCGIRTPWTLSSERVWTKTHRLGGYLYFAAGIVMLFGAFLDPRAGMALLLVSALTAALVPILMSFVWYRQEQAS